MSGATIAAPPAARADGEEELRERRELDRSWARRPGLWGWLTTLDHKEIAKRYVVTAFIWFLLGGINAALIRMQLMRPENTLLGPDAYNQIFTSHGTAMMHAGG